MGLSILGRQASHKGFDAIVTVIVETLYMHPLALRPAPLLAVACLLLLLES